VHGDLLVNPAVSELQLFDDVEVVEADKFQAKARSTKVPTEKKVKKEYLNRMQVLFNRKRKTNFHSIEHYSKFIARGCKAAETSFIFNFLLKYLVRKAWECLLEPSTSLKFKVGHLTTKLRLKAVKHGVPQSAPVRATEH
jgi:hypothetical protein